MSNQLTTGMFTSKSPEWATPTPFFYPLDLEFGFTLDAAATAANAKCEKFYDADSLSRPWSGVVWCNPPYGRGIGKWVAKGFNSARHGSTVVMLIPARTDTAWWHDYVMYADEVRFVRGRLQFVSPDAISNAPFPSAVVVFRPHEPGTRTLFTSVERGAHEQARVA